MTIEYGDPSMFLTNDELLQFRSLTGLLQLTNDLERSELTDGGEIKYYAHTTNRERWYRMLGAFTDLLVRDYETVVVTPADRTRKVFNAIEVYPPDPDQEVDHNAVSYTDNSLAEDKSIGQSQKGHCVPLLVDVSSSSPQSGHIPAFHLLASTIGTSENILKTEVNLDQHGSNLTYYLKSTYNAADSTSFAKAKQNLSAYVILNCSTRIYGRWKRGSEPNRTFMHYMTRSPDEVKQETDQWATIESKKLRSLTANEKKIIKEMINFLKVAKVDLGDLEDWNATIASGGAIQYDAKGRLTFQTLLAKITMNFSECIKYLVIEKYHCQKKCFQERNIFSNNPDNEELARIVKSLHRYALRACLCMQVFTRLKDGLRELLSHHLAYLKAVFDIKHTQQFLNVNHDPVSSIPSSDPIEELPEPMRKSGSKDYSYASEYEGLDSIVYYKGWDQGATKFLDLVFLHQTASNMLAKQRFQDDDQVMKYFFETAKIEHVQLRQTRDDGAYKKMDTVLKELLEQDSERYKAITDWIENHKTKRDSIHSILNVETNFKGNFHCMTIIICLHLVGLERQILLSSKGKTSANEHLQLPDKSITDRFKSIDLLPVSKICCPTCHALLQYIEKNSREIIMYPGHHTQWVACALPPWIPRHAGVAIIEKVNITLMERLTRIQQILAMTRTSSHSSDISPTHSKVLATINI